MIISKLKYYFHERLLHLCLLIKNRPSNIELNPTKPYDIVKMTGKCTSQNINNQK